SIVYWPGRSPVSRNRPTASVLAAVTVSRPVRATTLAAASGSSVSAATTRPRITPPLPDCAVARPGSMSKGAMPTAHTTRIIVLRQDIRSSAPLHAGPTPTAGPPIGNDAHGGPTVEAGGPDRGDARAISRAGDTRRRPRATRRVCARNFSLHLRTAPRYHGEDPDVLEP